MISFDGQKQYDARDLLASIIDANSMDEYKADYGKTIVTTYARIGGRPVGIVANQRLQVRTKKEGIQMGGVIYPDSADKAARFIMDCNQDGLPIVFFQDVTGFMVGRDAEQSGIIRSGAKLVSAVSNSIVPKITVVVGGSFGAGNYAMCGKAYDPRFIVAWPNARYAVMGAAQASDTVFSILARASERSEKKTSPEDLEQLRAKVKQNYEEQTDIRYGAARGWVDAIIQPHETRSVLHAPAAIHLAPDAERKLSHRRDSGLIISRFVTREFVSDCGIHRCDRRKSALHRQLQPALLQRTQNFFRWDIPDKLILRKGTTAKSTNGGIETPAPCVISGQDFRRCSRARAVQVNAHLAFTAVS